MGLNPAITSSLSSESQVCGLSFRKDGKLRSYVHPQVYIREHTVVENCCPGKTSAEIP